MEPLILHRQLPQWLLLILSMRCCHKVVCIGCYEHDYVLHE